MSDGFTTKHHTHKPVVSSALKTDCFRSLINLHNNSTPDGMAETHRSDHFLPECAMKYETANSRYGVARLGGISIQQILFG